MVMVVQVEVCSLTCLVSAGVVLVDCWLLCWRCFGGLLFWCCLLVDCCVGDVLRRTRNRPFCVPVMLVSTSDFGVARGFDSLSLPLFRHHPHRRKILLSSLYSYFLTCTLLETQHLYFFIPIKLYGSPVCELVITLLWTQK